MEVLRHPAWATRVGVAQGSPPAEGLMRIVGIRDVRWLPVLALLALALAEFSLYAIADFVIIGFSWMDQLSDSERLAQYHAVGFARAILLILAVGSLAGAVLLSMRRPYVLWVVGVIHFAGFVAAAVGQRFVIAAGSLMVVLVVVTAARVTRQEVDVRPAENHGVH